MATKKETKETEAAATEGPEPGSPEYSAAQYGGTPESHTVPDQDTEPEGVDEVGALPETDEGAEVSTDPLPPTTPTEE